MHSVDQIGPIARVAPRRFASVALAGVAVLCMGCAAGIDPQSAAATVPYQLDYDGRIVVDVTLDGQGPFPFLLDTGASISGVSASLQQRLGLPSGQGDVLIHGMTASARMPVARLVSIELGGVSWEGVRVAILPDDHSSVIDGRNVRRGPAGILGSDVLSRYAVGFSTRDKVLRLFLPETVSAERYTGWRSIALHVGAPKTPAAAMLFFDLSIEGRESRAIFDLGAGFNVVNWATAKQLGLTPERYARRNGDDLKGVFEYLPLAPRFVAGRTQTGQVFWHDEIYSIADLKIFSTLALGDRPAALIGAGLFAQRDFLIDFSAPRILVSIADAERPTVK